MSNQSNDKFQKEENGRRVERFLDLLMVNQNRIYAYILSHVPCVADADDIMQETTTLMWRKYDQFEPGTNFAAWGKAFAYFNVLVYRRTRPQHCPLSPEAAEVISKQTEKTMEEYQDRLTALKTCVKKLSKMDRHLVELRYSKGVSMKDISRQSGRSLAAIYRAVSRVHESLMRCIRRTLTEETVT